MGSDEDWEVATEGLRGALDDLGLDYVVNEGDGAFYGRRSTSIWKTPSEERGSAVLSSLTSSCRRDSNWNTQEQTARNIVRL